MHWIYLKHEFHTLSWITEINFHDIQIFWDAPVCQVCHPEICLCDIYAKTYNIDILKVLIDWNIVKANILPFFLIVASAGSSFSCFFLTVCQTQDSYFDNAENRAMPENQSSHSLSSLVYYLCLTVLRDYLTLFNISKKVMISVKLFTVYC